MKKNIALGLVASTLFLAGCCTTHKTAHWEYKKVYSIEEANKAAADGWIVTDFSAYSRIDSYSSGSVSHDEEIYLLKRPKQ
jgi:hypothetical protein